MRKLFVILVAAAATLAPMQAAEATLAKYGVTSAVSTSTIDLGKTFVLSGTVSPNAKGKTVKIQRKYAGGSWTTILTKTLSSTSKYSATIKPSKAGPTAYRVIKAASSSRAQGVSSSRTVNVYRWRYLLDMPSTRTPSTVFEGAVFINGYAFTRSLALKDNEYVDWNLVGKRCDKIKAYIGVDDDSVSDAHGDSYVYNQDSVLSQEGGLAKYQSARYVQIALGASTMIRIATGLTSSSLSGSWMAIGSPQAHCNS